MSSSKNLLLVPFDPVHDVGIRLVGQKLEEAGHRVTLLPPDLPSLEVVRQAQQDDYDFILIGRTMGYDVAQILGRLVDQLEAAKIRPKSSGSHRSDRGQDQWSCCLVWDELLTPFGICIRVG